MIRDHVREIFLFIMTINMILFFFLLLRKISIKLISKRKASLRKLYEGEVLSYIATGELSRDLTSRHFLSRLVIRDIILDYSSILKGDKKEELIKLLDREKMVKAIVRKIRSRNKWKRRIGAYEAGEYNVTEAIEDLIYLVDEEDSELVYIASLSLLKIGGASYICRILNRCLKSKAIEKSNLLYLIDSIDLEHDIEGILLNLMSKESNYLKIIALEACGKRQYMGVVEWIILSLDSTDKELLVSALKSALYLRIFPYDEHFEKLKTLKDSSDWEVRLFLAKNLGKVDKPESIELLKQFMTDPNWFVRNASGLTLLRKGNQGIRALVDTLKSTDRFASQKAREILEREIIQENLVKNIENREMVVEMMDNMRITVLEELI